MSMETNKLLIFNTSLIILAIFVIVFISYKGIDTKSPVPRGIAQIRDSYTKQITLSNKISMLLGALRITLYGDNPQIDQAKVSKILKALNPALDKASQEFGLTVKRWVELFKIWQLTDLPKLLKMQKKPSVMDFGFQAFASQINTAINESQRDFKLAAFQQVINPYPSGYNPNSKVYAKILDIYDKEAKKLIPEARKKLEAKSLSACMGPSSFALNPKSVAANIAWFQYYSRYCPFLVKNKIETLCATLRRSFPPSNLKAAKLRFEKGLAYCRIAKKRLEQEEAKAAEKYNHLTFKEYYKQYVKPLVPKDIKQLENMASKNNYEACSPTMLPVVSFRDPEVDAKLAAYEIAGPRICRGSSSATNGANRFVRWRALAYEALHTKKQ